MRKRGLLFIFLILAVSAAGLYAWLFSGLPSLEILPTRLNAPSVRIVDRSGRLLYEVLAEDGGRHVVTPLDEIPLALRQAAIATEDRDFYRNPGVDLAGVLRAAWINLRGGETLAGGSTITQQVARMLLLTPQERAERSLRRKLREGFLAWQLTGRLSKDEILALYLNQTYYGGMAYGVEAAAQTYFGKPVSELDLAECALIAGLPQAPALYNPFTDPDAAQARQEVVLGLMEADGYITAQQHSQAARETLIFAETPYPMEAPHFVMMVRAQIDSLFTPQQAAASGGLVVRTSLDLDWQRQAEAAVARHLAELQQAGSGLGHNVNNAALVALDPHSGEILALVGSPDYFDAGHGGAINMALAPRQPGSALKPLIYAVALDPQSGSALWTPATMLLDVHTSFTTQDGQTYAPENYDLLEHGPVLLRDALASSLNIPAVLALDHIGLEAAFNQAARLGITTLHDPETYDLSLALGGGAVRLLDLSAAYGAFANGGYRVYPHAILEVSDLQGSVLYTPAPPPQVRVLDERVAWLISDILSDNDARRIGFGANSILNLGRPAAVKTGTTSNFHDNWTVGYTPDLVVGVWAGNTDYQAMRDVSGLSGAAPIWHQFMRTALRDRPEQGFARPDGLVQVEVCALSGLLPTADCPYRRQEWFLDGAQPVRQDTFYRRAWLDSATGRLADASTPSERLTSQVVLDLPLPAQPWARSQGLRLYSDLLAQSGEIAAQAAIHASRQPLQLLSPAQGSIYRLTERLAPESQRIQIEAVGEPGLSDITLWLDGEILARFKSAPHFRSAPFAIWWTLAPGQHEVWAEAQRPDGTLLVSERVRFDVLAAP